MSKFLAKEDWVRSLCSPPEIQDNLTRYELLTRRELKDEENLIQVLSVGPVSEMATKSVFLIGETGAGKTMLINGFVNHLFGIEFQDSFRVGLKDQIIGDPKDTTGSQTDYITVYQIYHQEGMRYDFNFIVIDTPGIGDTRGKDYQKQCFKRLNAFFNGAFGVDELNCLGIVIKGNVNRSIKHEESILREVTAILGKECHQITQVLCTFTTHDALAVKVIEKAGVKFVNHYKFDNYPINCSKTSESEPEMDEDMNHDWGRMTKQHSKFFGDLQKSKAVNVKNIRILHRNKKKFHTMIVQLNKNIKELSSLHRDVEGLRRNRDNLHLTAQTIKWRDVVIKEKTTIRTLTGKDQHAHNCKKCEKTCLTCGNPSNVRAAIAGAAGGTGVGAAAVVGTATGVGVIAALATGFGYLISRTLHKKSSDCSAIGEKCGVNGCDHELEDHEICDEEISIESSKEERVDKAQKEQYDGQMQKVDSLTLEIAQKDGNLKNKWKKTELVISNLIKASNVINELTSGPETIDLSDLVDKMNNVKEDAFHLDVLKWVKDEIDKHKLMAHDSAVNRDILDKMLANF